jgi:hypothetical protein
MGDFRLDNNSVYIKIIDFFGNLGVLVEDRIAPSDEHLVHNRIIKVKGIFPALFAAGEYPDDALFVSIITIGR